MISLNQTQTIINDLAKLRVAAGYSRQKLAEKVGLTRQAIHAIEHNQYLPSTEVSLRLAEILGCSVEDLFRIKSDGVILEARMIGAVPKDLSKARAKVIFLGGRFLVIPLAEFGDILNFTVAADGLILGRMQAEKGLVLSKESQVGVQLFRDLHVLKEQIVIAGCDPAIFIAEEHFRRRRGEATVIGWPMGSLSALQALKRGEVHVAGIHVVDHGSGEFNLPFLKRHLKGKDFTVIRFAAWRQGFLVKKGNPKRVKQISDITKRGVRLINREEGAGARILLDSLLKTHGIPEAVVSGYRRLVRSHLEVGKAIMMESSVDVGIGVESAAKLYGLDFVPLQEERYDFVIPNQYLREHPRISDFLDVLVSRPLRTEIEALGGYDTKEIGKIIA